MNTDDIYQLFLNFDVPGVRKDAGRLWKGVNTDDAGVMNELLQAACYPSAGQRVLQAGEAVQQPCLAEERRFELKRKADDYEIELTDRQLEQKRKYLEVEELRLKLPLEIQKLLLEHVDRFVESLSSLNPAWRADPRLSVQAQDLLCNVFALELWLAATQGAGPGAKPRAVDRVWRGRHCLHGKRAYRCKQCHAC
jgi:hypothetical protein